MKAALILQPFGLGDCIFGQGIAWHFKTQGYKIYWPVVDQYLDDLKRAYPEVTWLPENLLGLTVEQRKELQHAMSVPIRWSNTIMAVPYKMVMRAKYDMYDLDWQMWRVYAKWQRNTHKEIELFDALGLQSGAPFTLICDQYSLNFTCKPITVPNGTKIVRMRPINGYSLFDWAFIMERATEIHAVASSNIYIFESIKIQAPKIYLYSRTSPHSSHPHYDYILQHNKYELK